MRKFSNILLIILCLFIFVFQSSAFSAQIKNEKKTGTLKKVLVKMKDNSEDINKKIDKIDKSLKFVKKLRNTNIHVLEADDLSIKELSKDKDVELVEEDSQIIKTGDVVPWNVSVVNAVYLHNEGYMGEGINVAIFDTGIDLNNTDLYVKDGVSCVEGIESYSDDNGHGTSMAGILSAIQNNEGLLGVAPKINLYSVKVLDSNGQGTYSNIIEGLQWAIDNDIDIISMSFGGTVNSQILKEAIDIAYDNGILLIASSGNDGNENSINYPAAYGNVICVGAVDADNQIASFSNRGSEIDLVAPGVGVVSTSLNNSTVTINGTSAAVPHVVGVAAQLLDANNELTNRQLKNLMCNSATNIGDNNIYGKGLPNAENALKNINSDIIDEGDDDSSENNGSDSDGNIAINGVVNPNDEIQNIYQGESVSVRVTFDTDHLDSDCEVTIYNENDPYTIIHTGVIQAPIYANVEMTFTCGTGILNDVGTYKVHFHCTDTDPIWDMESTVIVEIQPSATPEHLHLHQLRRPRLLQLLHQCLHLLQSHLR